MSAPVKIGVYIFVVTTLLAVALTVLVKTQVTQENVRQTLIPLIEKSLDRKVDFGEVTIGLFTGISVADFHVMQKATTDDLFSVAVVELRYQLWPLLLGRIVIDQVSLARPVINCTRLSDGQFNFSDLIPESSAKKGISSIPATKNNSTELPAAFNLLIKEVNVSDGKVFYVDKFKNPKSPFRYTLNKLNINVRQLALDRSFPIDISAVVNGSNIDVSGNYDMSQQVGDLTIHMASLDLLKFAPYFRDIIPGRLGSAHLSLNLEFDLQAHLISSKGTIALDEVDLVLENFPDAALKNTKLGADYALTYSTDKQLLDVSTLLLNFNGIKLGAEGEFDLSTSNPFLVFTLIFNQFDLREAMLSIPVELSRDYQKYSFAGSVDGRVNLSGRLSNGPDLLKSLHLNLSDIRASAENFRAGVSGNVIYEDKILQSENLLLQYGDQQLKLQVRAEKATDGLFHGDFNLTADTLDINKILPEQRGVVDQGGENGITRPQNRISNTQPEDIGPFDFPLDMAGTMAINRLVYKELTLNKVTAGLSLKNNYLAVDNLSGQIVGGEIKASSVVNLGVRGLTYQGELSAVLANVTPVVAGLFPQLDQSISGAMQLQSRFSGRGTIPANLLRDLLLKGEISLQNGEVKGSSLLEGLASILGSADLKILSFQSLNGQYDLHDGLTHLNAQLDSSKVKLTPTGTIAIDGRLDLLLDANFAPEVLAKLGINGSLKESVSGRDGWGRIPLKIQGTRNNPQFSYDPAALQNQIVEKASQKLLDKISPDAGGELEPIRKMLDNTLDKLFGK